MTQFITGIVIGIAYMIGYYFGGKKAIQMIKDEVTKPSEPNDL
jgi:hypothetical protein